MCGVERTDRAERVKGEDAGAAEEDAWSGWRARLGEGSCEVGEWGASKTSRVRLMLI